MKIQLSLLVFFLFFINFQAQQYIFGNVSAESGEMISGAEIVNIRSGQKYLTDHSGNFMIEVEAKDEIRIAKEGFERQIIHIKSTNFSKPVSIVLVKSEILIEEVNLVYKPTGNLKQDVKHYGDSRKLAAKKGELMDYIQQRSDPTIMASQPGEFVQPVGPGFSIGKVKNKWDKIEFYRSLVTDLGAAYFAEINIRREETDAFLNFALQNFDFSNILKYGYYTPSELMKIQMLIEEKSKAYKNAK
ncbi:hypothetical protein [Chryseobacterium sp.]|uniref:hypothetical protein n=1 Tax=Chryseobacterium sp. TaxID=1871047 RepID=UPI0011CB505A|nr:hypothetical protein [Chryseobacterium sp.]TXF76327.1 hypothetical protein FUA25_10610 [Chryseobacterium sp.]